MSRKRFLNNFTGAVLCCLAIRLNGWSYKCRAIYSLPGRTGSCMTGLWLLDDWTPLGLECVGVRVWRSRSSSHISTCDTCTELLCVLDLYISRYRICCILRTHTKNGIYCTCSLEYVLQYIIILEQIVVLYSWAHNDIISKYCSAIVSPYNYTLCNHIILYYAIILLYNK